MKMKPLHCTFGLLLFLRSASAQTEDATKPQHEIYYGQGKTTTEGLTIVPMSTEDNSNDDVAVMLQINKWRYLVKPNKPDLKLRYRLEFRRPGQEPQRIVGQEKSLSEDTEFTLTLMPKNGDLYSDDKYRTLVRQRPLTSKFGSIGVQDAPNPLKGLKFAEPSSSDPSQGKINADGSIVLWSFDSGEAQTKDKNQLVLVLAVKASEPNK